MVYLVAVTTGLRRSELASLTPASLHDLNVPGRASVTIRAADAKSGKTADLPLRDNVAAVLGAWIMDRGLALDFHSLRATFGSLLSAAGVAPRTVQELMRHSSINLTMGAYTDARLLDLAGAVGSLPLTSAESRHEPAPTGPTLGHQPPECAAVPENVEESPNRLSSILGPAPDAVSDNP